MADHRIVMAVPHMGLSGAGSEVEVSLGGGKRAEPHISRGAITWRPNHSKRSVIIASWAEFADGMES